METKEAALNQGEGNAALHQSEGKAALNQSEGNAALHQGQSKDALRREARRWRDSLPESLWQELSRQICGYLRDWQVFREAKAIYFYYPLGSEVDLLPAARLVLEQRKIAAFPRTSGERMDFYQVGSLEEFREGAFHVMEPVGALGMQEEAPLILVPGLAFDRQGGRVGYGKAYYDRYFQRFPDAVRAGICMEGQLVEQIPVENHDIRMDYLVTEKGMISCQIIGKS